MIARQRHIAHLHLHTALTEAQYDDVIELVSGITPHVQAIPPNALQVELTSALRYFDMSAYDAVQTVKMRLKAHYGIDCSAGLAGNRMLAAMAADASAPGDTTRVPTGEAADWLYPRPVTALPGIGRATADTLHRYGLHTIGQLTDLPPATLQRLLGAGQARLLTERARGHDPRPVFSELHGISNSVSADYRFEHDELNPDRRRRALLFLVDELGSRMRTANRVARALTLITRYADGLTTTRTRALAEPTAHTPILAAAAYVLHDALSLQRARVRAVSLRAEKVIEVEFASHQLTFDQQATSARKLEPVIDQLNYRWPGAVKPATLAGLTRGVIGN
ncbi:ImpB/MucB/SamB family protein [Streptomyces sp. NBC_00988]|uniref:DNA polymerase Y family protein n=1 Tax=Streptomyces sp. NBC_00988 TaxID=2903704 RepID=UPI00386AF0A6|nr:ImpB/MucB/SamB family protein [Streptomyces sp. NBC_00988]